MLKEGLLRKNVKHLITFRQDCASQCLKYCLLLCIIFSQSTSQHATFLSAVRRRQIAASHSDSFAWPRLDQVMRGSKRVEAESGREKKQ